MGCQYWSSIYSLRSGQLAGSVTRRGGWKESKQTPATESTSNTVGGTRDAGTSVWGARTAETKKQWILGGDFIEWRRCVSDFLNRHLFNKKNRTEFIDLKIIQFIWCAWKMTTWHILLPTIFSVWKFLSQKQYGHNKNPINIYYFLSWCHLKYITRVLAWKTHQHNNSVYSQICLSLLCGKSCAFLVVGAGTSVWDSFPLKSLTHSYFNWWSILHMKVREWGPV